MKTPYSWIADGHTTHLTTADKMGNVVSLTQTIGPTMGSKVATKGLGFLYAVNLGGYLGEYKPGDRSNSHISPTLFMKNGKVQLALVLLEEAEFLQQSHKLLIDICLKKKT